MPHFKNRERIPASEGLKCRCGKRAVWWIYTTSAKTFVPTGKTRKVGPYCPKCAKTKEFDLP